MCSRALGKYSVVLLRDMLILCSVGCCLIDSNTNLEHVLTLIQCLNVSDRKKTAKNTTAAVKRGKESSLLLRAGFLLTRFLISNPLNINFTGLCICAVIVVWINVK